MPSIAYNPPQAQAQRDSETEESHAVVLDEHKTPWTFEGKPFAPTLVMKVATLVASEDGQHSHLEALDHKMRDESLAHGVQLGWVIDPENKLMYEYKRGEESDSVYRVKSSAWRDLDGGAVLPGFKVFANIWMQCCWVRQWSFRHVKRSTSPAFILNAATDSERVAKLLHTWNGTALSPPSYISVRRNSKNKLQVRD